MDAKIIKACMIFSENHETKGCPLILGLKVVFQEEKVPNSVEPLCVVSIKPWQRPQN